MISNKEHYELLKNNRPSILRNSLLMYIYKVVAIILCICSVLSGISIFINITVGNRLLSFITGSDQIIIEEGAKRLSIFLGILFLIFGFLFYTIFRLSGKLLKRTGYIISLEEIMDEEIEKNIIGK